jgi:hypothetical protein
VFDTLLQYFKKKEQGMHKHRITSKVNSKADVTLQSFEDHLEQFRQSLINLNYANGTISPHIRCLNVLAEAMKTEEITLEELDETLAIEIIAKTGWMTEPFVPTCVN